MNEILNIIFQLLIMIVIFSAPLNLITDKNIYKIQILNKQNLYIKLSINIFFHLNILLIFSFLQISLEKIFYILVFFSTVFNIFYLYDSKIKIDKNFFIYVIFILAIFLKIAVEPKLEWDGLNHWLAKVNNFFNGTDIYNLKENGFAEYPHLGPYIWSFFWKNSISQYEYLGRLFYGFFYVTSLFCLIESFFKKKILFLIIIFFTTILTYDHFLFGGYQEYLIFSSLIIISKIYYTLCLNIKKKVIYNYLLLIILSQFIIWFKDEALFYYILFFSIIIFKNNFKYKDKFLLFTIVLIFPIIQYILQFYLIGHYGFQAELIHSSLWENLKPNIFFYKFLLISKYIFISCIKYKLWIINIIAILAIYKFFKKDFIILKPYIYILALNIILIYGIYFQTPYDIEFLLKVTLDRLIFQVSGFYLIFPLILIKNLINKQNYKILTF